MNRLQVLVLLFSGSILLHACGLDEETKVETEDTSENSSYEDTGFDDTGFDDTGFGDTGFDSGW